MAKVIAKLFVCLIGAYRLGLSGIFGGQCRFVPSCSLYAQQAIEHLGPLRGAWAAIRRIARCMPFSRGGYDPVPEKRDD
jgi:putative membrane protein insertion efficiency factor